MASASSAESPTVTSSFSAAAAKSTGASTGGTETAATTHTTTAATPAGTANERRLQADPTSESEPGINGRSTAWWMSPPIAMESPIETVTIRQRSSPAI